MQIRKKSFSNRGGDLVQLRKTKQYLEGKGVVVDVSNELSPNLTGYDLVHLFNLLVVEETYKQALNARRQRKPIILSSIYWNKDEYLLNNPNYKIKMAKFFAGKNFTRYLMKKRRYFSRAWRKQIKVLEASSLVLATSQREVDQIREDFGIGEKKFKIIPLGVEADIFRRGKDINFKEKYGLNGFILCVGRFDKAKNQLGLIKAMEGEDINLIFIGSGDADPIYYELCKNESARNKKIHILPPMEQNDLAGAYAAAKLHAAPSWFETFSLASLEAAAAGCNIVATNNSPLREYFGELLNYCNPGDYQSIKSAVERAFRTPKSDRLQNFVKKNFSWERVADDVLAAYKEVLFKK